MNVVDFITELYCKIDDALPAATHHSQALLSLSEVVTIGVLQAMKNVSQRAFYPWLKDNYGHLFPKLPHRTRLNRRLRVQQHWTGYFLAQPTVLGVADSYGIELRHPVRERRRTGQIGRKGKSNHRWMVGVNSASSSTSGAWWPIGIATPPTSMTRLSYPCWPAMTVR